MFEMLDTQQPEMKAAVEAVRVWCDDVESGSDRCLVLFGNTGSGKTTLLQAAEVYLTWHELQGAEIIGGLSSCIINMANVLTAIRAGFDSTHITLAQMMNDTADVYFIDDLGADNTGDWAQKEYLELINRLDGAPFLMTTNLALGEMRKTMGNRAASRLIDRVTSAGFVNMMNVEDYRVKRALK